MKVFVDSACDIKYASFYIEGLREVFGRRNVIFNSSRFRQFPHNNFYVPIEIEQAGRVYRVVIDFSDWPIIRPQPYDWCDLYCKINIAFEDAEKPKLFPIGPGFGIRAFSFADTIRHALSNLVLSGNRIKNKGRFLYDYFGQFKRPLSTDYKNDSPGRKNYLFFASSLWKNDVDTNRLRANYIRACKAIPQIVFEGGFAPRAKNDVPGFEDLTLEKRIGTDEYVAKTKKSLAVFNTPAVVLCHGWKLGEFLAMGKAVISTPLSRILPRDLVDRKHLLITDGSKEDIAQKIRTLLDDEPLRRSLEVAALSYYERHLAPASVITSILDRLEITTEPKVR